MSKFYVGKSLGNGWRVGKSVDTKDGTGCLALIVLVVVLYWGVSCLSCSKPEDNKDVVPASTVVSIADTSASDIQRVAHEETTTSATTAHIETVWISGTGKRYHSNRFCSNMEDTKEITREEAEERGLTPCGKCY